MEHSKVKGLYYHSNILSKKFQSELLEFLLNNKSWFPVSSYPNSRLVLHYGYKYNYSKKSVNEKAPDMPPIIEQLREKIGECVINGKKIDHTQFNQCIVNRYLPKQGIGKHTDHYKYGPIICCFTIGSTGSMNFTLNDEDEQVFTEKGSLYIMSGDARKKWKHEMVGQSTDYYNGKLYKRGIRYSLTFRKV